MEAFTAGQENAFHGTNNNSVHGLALCISAEKHLEEGTIFSLVGIYSAEVFNINFSKYLVVSYKCL